MRHGHPDADHRTFSSLPKSCPTNKWILGRPPRPTLKPCAYCTPVIAAPTRSVLCGSSSRSTCSVSQATNDLLSSWLTYGLHFLLEICINCLQNLLDYTLVGLYHGFLWFSLHLVVQFRQRVLGQPLKARFDTRSDYKRIVSSFKYPE